MKQKAGSNKGRKYDASFKSEVLKMVSDGRPVGEISQALGIGENLIYKWKSRQSSADQPFKPMHQELNFKTPVQLLEEIVS